MWSDFLAKMIKYLGVYSVYHNWNLLMPRHSRTIYLQICTLINWNIYHAIFSITGMGGGCEGRSEQKEGPPKETFNLGCPTWPCLLPRSPRSDLRICWKTIWSRSSSSNQLSSKLRTCHKNAYVHHDKRSLGNNNYFSKAKAETLDYIRSGHWDMNCNWLNVLLHSRR